MNSWNEKKNDQKKKKTEIHVPSAEFYARRILW